MGLFRYSRLDFLFTCVGLFFLLFDIVFDIWAVVTFYQDKAYVRLGLLLVFLLGSSALVQAFSWLWYRYDGFKRHTKVESLPSWTVLTLLHFLQLGIYFRLVVPTGFRQECASLILSSLLSFSLGPTLTFWRVSLEVHAHA